MGCSSCGKRAATSKFEARFSDGSVRTFNSEQEARAAVARKGGTYRRVA